MIVSPLLMGGGEVWRAFGRGEPFGKRRGDRRDENVGDGVRIFITRSSTLFAGRSSTSGSGDAGGKE